MAAVVPGAQELRLEMCIRRIASRMICARTLMMRRVDPGKREYHDCLVRTQANIYSDPNCGEAYRAAVDDTVGGYAAGCSQTNPSNLVSKPSSSPTCS